MLKLFNKEHVAISALTNLKDYKIEYLLSGEDLVEFSLSISDENIHLVEEEGYIRTKTNEYVIKAIDPSQEFKRYSCIVNVESILGKSIANFDTSNNNITDTIRLAIAGTGWILADNNITKRRTVRLKNTNALEVLREIRKVFRVDFRYDAINKTIYVYEQFGSDKGVYFSDELNLRNLSIPSDTYDYVTRIIPKGKDGLTIASINGGKDYIDNFQYSNKVIEVIWEDNRYTDINSLKADAEAKLEELSKPKRSYQADISDLAKQSEEYKFLDFFLGDTITLLSKQEKFKDKQRIVKYIQYPNEPHMNTCELGNTTLTFEDLQKENEAKNNVVDNITSDNGTVDGSKVDNITTEQISDFEASVGKITDLTVVNAKISNLEAHNVTITGELNSVKANIGTLTANVANIDKLVVNHAAEINNLIATTAKITDLNATNATIDNLEVTLGKIQTLVNGNLSSENMQAGGITSDKLTIANGFITNAMIANLDVSKINAGEISTSKFRIKSDDGSMEFVGATQQFKDKNNRVRIQMGKDAQGNFNFIIRGEDGTTTLIDHTGVKAKAIADNLIVNNMIATDAVGEKQINYSSFVTGFNKDTNTSTIKSTKIMLNNQNQTLELAFNSLKTQADGTKLTTESNSTTIGVMQGQISTAINNTQIVKDGQTILLKDDYNRTVATVDSMKSTIGSHTTKIDANTGKIGTVETKTNELERTLNSVSSRLTSTETTVTTHTTNITKAQTDATKGINDAKTAKTQADKGVSDAKGALDKANAVDGRVTTLNTTVTTTNSKVSAIEQNLNSITQKVSSVETTTSTLTTKVNAVDGKIDTAKNQAIIDARKSPDTRNKNENPSWYFTNFPRQTISEFKIGNVVGVTTSSTYGTVTTVVPWTDKSGGYPVQTWRSNYTSTFERVGTSDTTWSTWKQIEDINGSQSKSDKALNDAKSYTTTEITKTNNKVATIETNLNAITSRVSTVETKQTTVDGKVTALETWKKQAEVKITDASIISTVSSQFYKKGETDGKYASQSQITQLSNQIATKVDVNGVVSTIQQNPESVRIGFNKISAVIYIDSSGMKVSHTGNSFTKLSSTELYQANEAGDRTISMRYGGVRLYKWAHTKSFIGSISATRLGSEDKYGPTLFGTDHSWYLDLGMSEGYNGDGQVSSITPYVRISRWDNASDKYGVNIHKPLHVNQPANINAFAKFNSRPQFEQGFWINNPMSSEWNHIAFGTSSGYLVMAGDRGMDLGVLNTINSSYKMIGLTKDPNSGIRRVENWCNWNFQGFNLQNANLTKTLTPQSNELKAYSRKNKSINDIYSSMTYTNGEVRYVCRENQVINEGTLLIEIPQIISENIELEYHINISKMTWGDYRIVEKTPYYFIIEGSNKFIFTFEIVAKLLDKAEGFSIVASEQYNITENKNIKVENKDVESVTLHSRYAELQDCDAEKLIRV